MSKQPTWKFVTNLGDANPFYSDGIFLFEDTTGSYSPELEYYNAETGSISRFCCDKVKEIESEWYFDKLDDVCDYVGTDKSELILDIQSDNILDRAWAYTNIVSYFGLFEFDQYPAMLTDIYDKKKLTVSLFNKRYKKYGIKP